MIQKNLQGKSLFDKANVAATNAMQSVVDLASQTRTPVIVFRNGQIERIEPEMLQKQLAQESKPDQKQERKTI